MASSPSTTASPSNGSLTDFSVKQLRQGADGSVAAATTTVGDWGYQGVSTATTTVVKTGAGQLGTLLILGGTLGAVTVYDNTAASGTVIAPTFTPGAAGALVFNCAFTTGLTIVTAAATSLTVLYR